MDYTEEVHAWLEACPNKYEVNDIIDGCLWIIVRNAVKENN